ncbi:serine carboxypeptidase-like 1 [Abrus precatorius]|uniref:Serine carboxypeptidase-like 1 n=1 Tax=Abrus precatorius TaxID=3816 RepID=A0A8B8KAN7_ABRPR|nr:serine carboxypeptidase-like 1 [Abrus precatorius]
MSFGYGSVILVALMLLPHMASAGSTVKNLPGYEGDLPFKLETGYVGVGEEEQVQIFYLFVESQRNPFIDPLLLWLVGGPGCSALSAFFFENGPLVMNENYSGKLPKLELNRHAWTHSLNMIYIDMPVGTGFSYSQTQEG